MRSIKLVIVSVFLGAYLGTILGFSTLLHLSALSNQGQELGFDMDTSLGMEWLWHQFLWDLFISVPLNMIIIAEAYRIFNLLKKRLKQGVANPTPISLKQLYLFIILPVHSTIVYLTFCKKTWPPLSSHITTLILTSIVLIFMIVLEKKVVGFLYNRLPRRILTMSKKPPNEQQSSV